MVFWTNIFVALVVLYCAIWFILKRVLLRSCVSKRLMFGKTVIVTGANCGIGKGTAQELVRRHARVIMACRDVTKATAAARDIRKVTSNGEIVVKHLDLVSFKSVRKFCREVLQEEKKIDVLIHNAGVFNHPFMLTEDGLEVHMSVNHFANFLLTHLLLERIKDSAPSRIIFVSTFFYKNAKFGKSDVNMNYINSKKIFKYPESKLANVYFARELHKRLKDSGVSIHTVNPGVVHTQIGRYTTPAVVDFIMRPVSWLIKTPLEGCQTVLHCAISEELDNVSGHYYSNCKVEPWSKVCLDEAVSNKIWELSERLTGLDKSEMINNNI